MANTDRDPTRGEVLLFSLLVVLAFVVVFAWKGSRLSLW